MKEFKFPDVGEGIHEGTIVKWRVKEGDAVKADQVIVEVETDKAVVELPSPASGNILKINFREGEVVKVGEVLVAIGEPGETVPAATKPSQKLAPVPGAPKAGQPAVPPQPSAGGMAVLATPATRQLARDLGVDISKVKGSGPAGRISEDDVRKTAGAVAQRPVAQAPTAQLPGAPTAPSVSVVVESREGDQRIPLTGVRKIIAERMTYSKTHIPHACGMDDVDVTRLVEIREKEKRNFEPKGVKLTYLPFIVKACAIALKKYPYMNAHFDEAKNEIVLKKDINIGIAVATPEGLVVPVVKDIERKSIVEIAQDIEHLATAARERKLRLEDIRGGTFTITNVGSVGARYSTPIINPPEVAILGVHRIKEMPLVVKGKIKPRMVMGISLCFDHRVVDGAVSTEFTNAVKQHLEDPDLMLVDMI